MARLADALQRANRRRDDRDGAPDGPVALEPAPQVRSRVPERVALAPGSTPLLDFSTGQTQLTGWRTDPELVGKLVGTENVSSGALEQYRKLAATLHHAQSERGIQVVMTASSLPGEGKSLTAVNLALTLSESYHRRVLLIDADLRRPTVQRLFGLTNLNPQPCAACEVAQPRVGLIRVGHAFTESQRAVARTDRLQFVRLQRQGDQADHHAFIGLTRVARQCEGVI